MKLFSRMHSRLVAAIVATCVLLPILGVADAAEDSRKPTDDQIMSRWAAEVTPENVLPEYPRPMMVREEWLNLNGLWDYAVVGRDDDQPDQYDGEILVPFPVESALSGVKKPVGKDKRLWYRRVFYVPAEWRDRRLLLHFGAVDWDTTVWVNGRDVGSHKGGYDPFTFDITHAIDPSLDPLSPQDLIVSVWDPTDEGHQPSGKQRARPRGFWYTAVTGIWQTVWLEPVPRGYIQNLEIIPDIDAGTLSVRVQTGGSAEDGRVKTVARDAGALVAEATGAAGEPLMLNIPGAKLWSPESPFLYDLEVTLLDGNAPVDAVKSYFGMRKISMVRDKHRTFRIALNNQILFQYGALDQGWWPDGLYRVPTDEALRYDVEVLKKLGFNMLRKHIKVEPQRFYYWCDKLGMIVWQDMPSGDITGERGTDRSPESARQFELELERMVTSLYNHPGIVVWVIFNEGWGQYNTEQLTARTKERDASRLVINASGFVDKGVGDIHSVHSYPGPTGAPVEKDRALVLGEFGGLALSVEGHLWQPGRGRGRRGIEDADQLAARYEELLVKLRPYVSRGLSAAVYTQVSDVENELNGLMTYDRSVIKMDTAGMLKAAKALYAVLPGSFKFKSVVATSQEEPQQWRYTTEEPPEGWAELGFDDSSWSKGAAGFGDPNEVCAVVRTAWSTKEIWMRKTFELSAKNLVNPYIVVYHDFEQETQVYLNGELAARGPEHQFAYTLFPLDKEARDKLKDGENVLAVHGVKGSRQYIDVGLLDLRE